MVSDNGQHWKRWLTFAGRGSLLAPHGDVERTAGVHRMTTARSPVFEAVLRILSQLLAVLLLHSWIVSVVAVLDASLHCFDLRK